MRTRDLYRYWLPYSRISLALLQQQRSAVSDTHFFSQAKLVVNLQQQVRELKPYAEQALLHDDAETRNIHHHFLNGLRAHLLKAYQHSPLLKRSQSGERPTVFISYAWCIEEFFPWEWWTQPFLVRFAMDLYQLGFNPRLDVLHSRFGPSSIEYMMKELNSADLVFPIGTRSLRTKMVGDRYFQSAIRHEMRGIGDRKVRCAEAGQVDGIMPLQLMGSDVVEVFPGHYPQHTVIESFQQPESSYLAMLCDIVKHAYYHFTGVPKLAIKKAMMEVESADHSLYSSIQKAKADSVLSLYFHRLSDEAVQHYNEACVAKETTVEQQRLQKTLAFVEQQQLNKFKPYVEQVVLQDAMKYEKHIIVFLLACGFTCFKLITIYLCFNLSIQDSIQL